MFSSTLKPQRFQTEKDLSESGWQVTNKRQKIPTAA